MDKLKTRVLFISLVILALLTISAVAAADSDVDVTNANQEDFDLSEEIENDVSLASANTQEDADISTKAIPDSDAPLTADETGNFSQLQTLINGIDVGGTLELDSDYIRLDGESALTIKNEIVIDGKGKTIDANLGGILTSTAKVTLKNIIFINPNGTSNGAINLNTGSAGSTIDNCTFIGSSETITTPVIRWNSDDGKLINSSFKDIHENKNTGIVINWIGKNALVEDCSFTNITLNGSSSNAIIDFKSNKSQLINSNFTDNKQLYSYSSAKMVTFTGSEGLVDGCNFIGNDVYGGSLVYFKLNDNQLLNSNFTNNNGSSTAKNVYVVGNNSLVDHCNFINDDEVNYGGTVQFSGENGKVSYCNFTISNNTNGAVKFESKANNSTVENCNFEGTSSVRGRMIYNNANNTSIISSNFTNIESSAYGSAIYSVTGENLTIDGCNFKDNEISNSLIDSSSPNTVLNSSTFTDNVLSASYYSLVDFGSSGPGSDNSTIENCTFIESKNFNGRLINWESENGKLVDSTFTFNNANSTSSAVYWDGKNGLVDNCNFTGDDVSRIASAISFHSENETLSNSNFKNLNTTRSAVDMEPDSANSTIKYCNFTDNFCSSNGAAIRWDSDNGTVISSNFTNNKASNGGAIEWQGENGKIDGCNFTSNGANSNGGAIDNYGKNLTINNTNFSKNHASNHTSGGALSSFNDDLTIDNCVFEENFAGSVGGAIYLISNGVVNITNTNFYNNTVENEISSGEGGAIYVDTPNIHFDNVEFINNTAPTGGAFSIDEKTTESDNVNITVANTKFIDNTADHGGGAVHTESPDYLTFDNCQFIRNTANGTTNGYGVGGAIYSISTVAKINVTNSKFVENTALGSYGSGGAIYCTGNDAIINSSSFANNTAGYSGGAISSNGQNAAIEGCNFTENSAIAGGAIVSQGNNLEINNSNFTENNATQGGAVFLSGKTNDASINNSDFKSNLATYGGAIVSNINSLNIDNAVFNDNNATAASAIYHVGGSLDISNSELLENQAKSRNLTFIVDTNIFDANVTTDFRGYDNLLNGIYTNDNEKVTLTNVTYWGYADEMNTGDSEVIPVASADDSEDGDLVYKDFREAGINITLVVYDSDGTEIFNKTIETGIFGNITAELSTLKPGKYKAYAIHKEDAYYTSIEAETEFEIGKQNSAVNGTNVEYVYGDPIPINVTSENATGVSYKVIGKDGVVKEGTVNVGENITGLDLAVGDYTVHYVTVVDTDFYNNATNTSTITVTPAPSCVNGTNETEVYGDPIVVTVVSVNATNVTYYITNSTGGVVVPETTMEPNGEITGLDLAVGEYTVHYVTVVDENHTIATNTSTITVTPAPSCVNGTDVEKVYGEPIDVTVASENATSVIYNITNASGAVVVENTEIPANGTFTVPVTLDVGEYTVNYVTVTDDNHEFATNTSTITVTKALSAVSADDVTEPYGYPVDVTVASENATSVTYNVTNSDGEVVKEGTIEGNGTFTVSDLPVGEYTVELTTVTDKNHESVTNTSKITVRKLDVIVSLPEVINYTGAVVDIIVNVTDEFGLDVNEGTVTLIIDWGTKLSDKLMATAQTITKDVHDGKATFSGITLGDPGTYPSKAEFSGTEHYNSAENESYVIVLPLNTTTDSDDVSGKAGDKKDITADIVDQNGDPVKNGTAVLKVNGKEYTAEVINGKATFKNVELPDESTDATIEYLGNDYYNPSNTTIKITIIPDEPIPDNNTTEPVTPIAEKAVPVIPAAGNPIALVVLALLTLVSTVSLGKK